MAVVQSGRDSLPLIEEQNHSPRFGRMTSRQGRSDSNMSKFLPRVGWATPTSSPTPDWRSFGVKEWKVPNVYGKGDRINLFDVDSIYGTRHENWYSTVTSEEKVSSPVQASPRLAENNVDPQNIAEKSYVLWNYYKTNQQRRFTKDKALVPSVYQDLFECPSRKRNYVKKQFTESSRKGSSKTTRCMKVQDRLQSFNHYCDVVGNKYCAYCIEQKNRNFAAGFEKVFSPFLKVTTKRTLSPSLQELFLDVECNGAGSREKNKQLTTDSVRSARVKVK